MSDECSCAPDLNGMIVHNSWSHPEWRTPAEGAAMSTTEPTDEMVDYAAAELERLRAAGLIVFKSDLPVSSPLAPNEDDREAGRGNTRRAIERAWADGYSQGATPGQPRPGNPWSAPVSGIWSALTDDQRLATLLFVEQRGEELFAAPVTVGHTHADETAVALPAEATSLGVDLMVWLGLSGRIRWDVLVRRSATVEGFDTLRSMEGLTPGIPILNLSGRRHKEREELRSAMQEFAAGFRRSPVPPSAPIDPAPTTKGASDD